MERDESPQIGSSIDAVVDTPVSPNFTMGGALRITGMDVKTPETVSRLRPPTSEMHPKKAHVSTAKKPDSALKLGFSDFNTEIETPTKSTAKAGPSSSNPIPVQGTGLSSPTFNFSWNRPESQLGPEAQRIMASVRIEAERIKSQMKKEEEQQKLRDKEAEEMFGVGNRKIASAKPRNGRFSDAHRKQFGKMNSIADHPSAWKSKFTKAPPTLKRTTSTAGFDEEQEAIGYTNFSRPTSSGRIENTAPGKRMKKTSEDDVSSRRPVSRDDAPPSSIPTPSAAGLKLPSAVTTPTKASLARATSVKNMSTSKLPTLPRSKSTKTLSSPVKKPEGPEGHLPDSRSETKRFLSGLPRFNGIKSILHKPQPKYSDDPEKIAAGTHLQSPLGVHTNGQDVAFPEAPRHVPGSEAPSSPSKRVNFSASTKSSDSFADPPASPSKIPTALNLHAEKSSTMGSPSIEYPSLPGPSSKPTAGNAKPGEFTFRTSHPGEPVSFPPPTSGLDITRTIRPVRPSGIATPLAPFENMPTVPHGMNNKKRRRIEAEDDEMLENIEPGSLRIEDGAEGPQKKKVRSALTSPVKANASPSKIGKFVGGAKGKAFLSRARLSALARPKERR